MVGCTRVTFAMLVSYSTVTINEYLDHFVCCIGQSLIFRAGGCSCSSHTNTETTSVPKRLEKLGKAWHVCILCRKEPSVSSAKGIVYMTLIEHIRSYVDKTHKLFYVVFTQIRLGRIIQKRLDKNSEDRVVQESFGFAIMLCLWSCYACMCTGCWIENSVFFFFSSASPTYHDILTPLHSLTQFTNKNPALISQWCLDQHQPVM